MSMVLKAEFLIGTNIYEATRELVDLATKLGIPVVADFNGVELIGSPGDDPNELENRFHRELGIKVI